MGLLKKLFGTSSEKELRAIKPIVDKIEALDGEYSKLTDEQLKAKTPEFKQRIANGESLDDILPEAFAACREAAWRVLGMKPYSQKSKFLFIIITCTVLCLLLPVAAPLLLSFFIGMAVKEAKINKYTELLEEGLSYFGTFFLGLILGVLCEASTILNPTVIIILVIGILALAISAVGGLLGGWLMYLVHKAKREDFNPTIGIAGVSCVPTTAKLAQHAAQDENPFAVILPVAMGANISGVITSAIAAGIFVTTIGMV